MPAQSLLTESSALQTFRYLQVEQAFINGCPTNADDSRSKASDSKQIYDRISALEQTVVRLEKAVELMQQSIAKLHLSPQHQQQSKPDSCKKTIDETKSSKKEAAAVAANDDDDVDLFGSDDDEEAEALRKKRVEEYAAKKAKKPALVAKSSVVLDVKPWDDETDMEEMQKLVRSIEMDGLVWGAAKLVPLAFGIKKLQIVCVIEDEKVSVEELQEKLCEFEDHVQSVDIAAFNKI
ncbi:hypothetical protein NH340_JMT06697 [Sarcoptes scabiei]|nr:hypothetical protein NH340_JMT06697 [Sarcoptes scabiei]